MKVLKWSCYIMTIMTIIYIVLTFAATAVEGVGNSLFNNVWMVLLFAIFAAVQIICLFTKKLNLSVNRIGFFVLHVGLVLFLLGSFIYYISGDKLNVSIPVDPNMSYSRVKRDNPEQGQKQFVDLGFDIGVSNFLIEKYEPNEGGYQADKYYEATLMITNAKNLKTEDVALIVNYPHHENGWKIYLMGHANEQSVNLMFKRDPGEYISLIGIWFIIGGSVMMCLLKKRKAGDSK